jgi:tricorn protease
MIRSGPLALSFALCLLAGPAAAQVDARMFRYPDVSATHIAFVYAGDIWVVPKTGGVANRLSSPLGEEAFPRFSPDGSKIAYSANYDGNTDVYVVPTMGGEPVRVTYHPLGDRLVDWHPDGKRVLFASGRESGRQRYNQFYLAGADGGLPAKLPIPYGEFGAFSEDGRLFAYMPMSQDFRTWKRYRGGWAGDIWLFDLKDSSATNITQNDADDGQPMWHGNTLYFLSDRGANQRHNIWAYDRTTKAVRQVTQFKDFDVAFPAIGPTDIVFQAGSALYVLDLASDKVSEVKVSVVTDEITLKPRAQRVGELIRWADVSPTGKRAVFNARNEILTVPAENGPILNLSRTPGTGERYPTWSPDGKTVAYWSDRSGEYELYVRPADGSGEEKKLTSLGAGYRYHPDWSPDGKKIAFADQLAVLRIYDLDKDRVTEIDRSKVWMGHGQLEGFTYTWSADSRWLAYARPDETRSGSAVFLYDTKDGTLHQATSGYFGDAEPAFDPDGKYLYFLSNRSFEPVYGDFDNSWTYPNATRIVAVPLRLDVPSPLAPKNDVEGAADTAKKGQQGQEGQKGQAKPDSAKVAEVAIDLAGFEGRAVILPPKGGNYGNLRAVKGKVLYARGARTGSGETKSPLVYFDLEEREEKTVLDDAGRFVVTHDGKKALVMADRRWAIVEVKPAQKMDKPLRTAEIETTVDPRAEWRQMFQDAYRFERDFFYDPNMHGVDWKGLRDRYAKLVDDAVTRWDVNFVLGEFIAELNSSHTYRGGGDEQSAPRRAVGMLGVDWALENGAYRIGHIAAGGPWDADARSPLKEPGVDVKEGDYVLAVNGVPLDISRDPWAAFQGLADAPVMLTVNARPTMDSARQVLVKPLADDTELRFREWIEARRQHVDQATGGKVGYIYVQSTGVDAQNELVKQFMAQWRKDGLIIDERFNSGGQIPDRFIELLNRPMLSYWAVRNGEDWQWPPVGHRGPKVMLINGWSGSGGDAFPFYFREAKVGPLIGMRTWGGLIGISGAPSLADGGQLTVPTFRMYDVTGKWFPEGHGVEPDIAVVDDPAQLVRGTDPQIERAIQEVQRLIRERPPTPPKRPEYEKRIP